MVPLVLRNPHIPRGPLQEKDINPTLGKGERATYCQPKLHNGGGGNGAVAYPPEVQVEEGRRFWGNLEV